ncbi:hypothetical protein Pogu_1779 [Pyrobaculum oguniense TE7]|uniref:Uncharacterized protein n=2 Tax=Pyrobaculum oguniense TaxID=99007 RepID=H6Q9D8_PYROT|nr:hypothetical protein Pogu_1779 [Pyrobaculum oguniense TE7]BAC56138.1 hypothetical protein [Pyrobaculum oguniense TE7]
MNSATLLLLLSVVVAVGMVLLNYGLTYSKAVYDAFANSPGDPATLREDPVERTWMLQSAVWTSIFALSIIAVMAYLYYLAKEEFK